MNDKKRRIIEGAMQLFSQKGFQQISMQEIADHIGIAKGSIYHYYKSKDELLREIFWHYYELISKKMKLIEEDPLLTVRQKFHKQLIVHLSTFIENRDFILINLKNSFDFNEEFESFCIQVHKEIYKWFEEKFIEMYGEDIKPYTLDLSTSLQGMVKEYLTHFIFQDVEVNLHELAKHLLKQCDILAEGLKSSGSPFLTKQMFQKEKRVKEDLIEEKIHYMISTAKKIGNLTIEEIAQALLEQWKNIKKAEKSDSSIIIKSLLYYLENIEGSHISKEDIQFLKSKLFEYQDSK